MTIPAASAAQIAAAETYERLFVPAEFQEWASRVAGAADLRPGQRVLDVACGTGVLAREAARRVGESGAVAGVDPDPGMLAVAARIAPGIDYRQAGASALPYDDGIFDAVISQFGLMYFGDRRAGLREMGRVLRTGGRLVVAVWGSLERTPAYADLVAVIARTLGRDAADTLRAPFVLGDVAALAGLCASAGIPDAAIVTHVGKGRFANARAMVEAELRGWFPVAGIAIADEAIERTVEEAVVALAPYVTPAGHLEFDAPAHIVSAIRR